jgi:hypothetical protein
VLDQRGSRTHLRKECVAYATDVWAELPAWLREPVEAVLTDLQGDDPIPDISVFAYPHDDMDGPVLGLFERGSGGGRLVDRSLAPAELLCEVAEVLQDELAETAGGWGQSRPPCPYHPHPARPVIHSGGAWWCCPQRSEHLYRIGHRTQPSKS